MGIVETILSDFELSSGESIRVEYNEGGKVHIHIDNITLGLSPKEFQKIANVVDEAQKELTQMKE